MAVEGPYGLFSKRLTKNGIAPDNPMDGYQLSYYSFIMQTHIHTEQTIANIPR